MGVAGNFAGDHVTPSAAGISYFGYDQSCPRRLSNYARENFIEVKFLRLCDWSGRPMGREFVLGREPP